MRQETRDARVRGREARDMRREGLSLASCVFLSCLLSLVSRPLFALVLPPQFADGAVFAKNEPIRVFGDASAPVKVTLGDRTATAKPGEDGKFLAELPALPAGGPYELVVESGGTKKTLSDVRIGTVVMIGDSPTPRSRSASRRRRRRAGRTIRSCARSGRRAWDADAICRRRAGFP